MLENMENHSTPELNLAEFNCPHCGSFSDQYWTYLIKDTSKGETQHGDYRVSSCRKCGDVTIWHKTEMIYPFSGNAPLPNSDMPESAMNDFLEARDIVNRSPRSSCVLLRLAIEKICDDLKVTGELNEKIKKLVERGLDERIQKALDAVRVIGGEAVHPLKMDLKDDSKTASSLFSLVNIISNWAYTEKKKIEDIFGSLPEGKKEAISKRDKK